MDGYLLPAQIAHIKLLVKFTQTSHFSVAIINLHVTTLDCDQTCHINQPEEFTEEEEHHEL